jgi:hypothetical protein
LSTATNTFILELMRDECHMIVIAMICDDDDDDVAKPNVNPWKAFCSRVQALADRHKKSPTMTSSNLVPTTTDATTTDTTHSNNSNSNNVIINKVVHTPFISSTRRRRSSGSGSGSSNILSVLEQEERQRVPRLRGITAAYRFRQRAQVKAQFVPSTSTTSREATRESAEEYDYENDNRDVNNMQVNSMDIIMMNIDINDEKVDGYRHGLFRE